jgi:hypothetical protein
MGFGGSLLGIQWVWHENDPSPQFSAEVMMHADIPRHRHAFIAWCCIKYTDNFNHPLPVSMLFIFIPPLFAFIVSYNFFTINIQSVLGNSGHTQDFAVTHHNTPLPPHIKYQSLLIQKTEMVECIKTNFKMQRQLHAKSEQPTSL